MVLFSDIRKWDCRFCRNMSLWNRRHVTDERLQYLGTTHTCARTWLWELASQCSHLATEICRWKDGWISRMLQNILSVDSAGKDSGSLDRLYVSIVIMSIITNAVAIHYSLPRNVKFPRLHTCVSLPSPRFLCINHSAKTRT